MVGVRIQRGAVKIEQFEILSTYPVARCCVSDTSLSKARRVLIRHDSHFDYVLGLKD